MSKIEGSQSPEVIRKWSGKDKVIGSFAGFTSSDPLNDTSFGSFGSQELGIQTYLNTETPHEFKTTVTYTITFERFSNPETRICGLITGQNEDESLQISLLGNDTFFSNRKAVSSTVSAWTDTGIALLPPTDYRTPEPEDYPPYDFYQGYPQSYPSAGGNLYDNVHGRFINLAESFEYVPVWEDSPTYLNVQKSKFLYCYSTLNGQGGIDGNTTVQLTKNKDTTLKLGVGRRENFFEKDQSYCKLGLYDIGGNVYTKTNIIEENLKALNSNRLTDGLQMQLPDASGMYDTFYICNFSVDKLNAKWYTPFNIVLTYDYEQAINYIENDVLPTDAFIYPFDVDSIPVNTTGEDDANPEPGDEPGDDDNEPNEDGNPSDDVDPIHPITPTNTGQSLTNNNLYWLEKTQLENFITWFWTGATDIATLNDLWDKIRGLYENLVEAVLSIRYMPIDISWIGGTHIDTSIIVGQIEDPVSVLAINKTVAPLRQIGTIKINEEYKSFCDYSPYSQMSLFLPFHGFIDLDNDMIMNTELAVMCSYDILSGTIQYYIMRGGYNGQIINTVACKMSIEIPISLQTKTQRDSAVLSNVSSGLTSLVGATASAVTGNPIGMVMSMTNFAGTQTQGAPMSVKGTISEQGAFYQPTKCAIYRRLPKYNRPKLYSSRVGYPVNGQYKLSSISGYVQVYDPYIEFNGSVKPLESEVEEIYNYLSEGVIL